jgi:hypothetical protein
MLMRAAVLCLVAAALGAPAADAATARLNAKDEPNELRWSDRATWGGEVPGDGAQVVVPAGATVLLDTDTATLRHLRIEGTLRFAAADVELKADGIVVSGALQIGSAQAPHRHRATITLGGLPAAQGNDGVARGLNVVDGRLELHGAAPQPVWTRLAEHASAGTKRLVLTAAADWRAGTTLAIAPTDFYGVAPTERLVLAADAQAQQVNTREPLAAARWGRLQHVTSRGMSLTPEPGFDPGAPTVLDQRAPVAALSRAIVIQGADDAAWRERGFGAHVMVMGAKSRAVIDGVELRRVGQAGTAARYPVHWHLLGKREGDAIRRSAIWASSQRCIVVHGTSGVAVTDNVCHDIRGHAVFLEDGNERGNVIERNLVLGVRTPKTPLKLHDRPEFMRGPSGFWVTNPDNVLRGNVAADAEGNGFWLAFSRKPKGDAAGLPLLPDRLPLGSFDDNVAHSNGAVGINLDFAPMDEAGNIEPNKYIPTPDGSESRYTNHIRVALRRNVTWKNIGAGFWNRISQPDYSGWISADNAGVHFAGAGDDGLISGSLLIGKSLNHRSYPQGAEPPSAFATYHSTYAMRDNVIVAFDYVPGQNSGAFRTNDYYTLGVDKGTVRNPNNRLIASHPGHRTLPPNLDGQPLNRRHWTYAGALWDPHGYWGTKGQYWVIDHPFLTTGATCQPVAPAGNGQSCAGEYYGVGGFQTDFDTSRYSFQAAIDVTRQDANGNPIGSWSVADGATSTMLPNMRHFAARPNGRYLLKFPGKPNPRWFAMSVGNAYRSTDSFVIGIAFDGNANASGYTVSGHEHNRQAPPAGSTRPFSQAHSLAEVVNGNGTQLWQDRANHVVWIKVQGGMAWPHAESAVAFDDNSLYRNISVVLSAN